MRNEQSESTDELWPALLPNGIKELNGNLPTRMAPQTRLVIQTVAITLCVLAIGGALAAYAFMMSGFYNIGATKQHWQPVYSFLETGMHQSVRLHAREIAVPPLNENMARAGTRLYAAHCALCHGAPGVAPSGIGMSMQPVPGPLVDAKDKWRDRELYWIVRHGIKMSGMPAWEFRLADDELWQLVAFIRQMPDMTPADYAKRVQESPP